jgi:hypothetical protein
MNIHPSRQAYVEEGEPEDVTMDDGIDLASVRKLVIPLKLVY